MFCGEEIERNMKCTCLAGSSKESSLQFHRPALIPRRILGSTIRIEMGTGIKTGMKSGMLVEMSTMMALE